MPNCSPGRNRQSRHKGGRLVTHLRLDRSRGRLAPPPLPKSFLPTLVFVQALICGELHVAQHFVEKEFLIALSKHRQQSRKELFGKRRQGFPPCVVASFASKHRPLASPAFNWSP